MPYFDGTGPYGRGPMLGRSMGYCGQGFRRRRFTQKETLEMLSQEEKALEAELVAIREEKKNLKI